MQMHRRGDRDIGDGRVVGAQPFAPFQRRLQDRGEIAERRLVRVQHRLVRRAVQNGIDDILDQIDIAGVEPLAAFPEQPAGDVGANLRVGRIGRPVAGLLRPIDEDGIRLPQHEVAVHQRGQFRIRVDRPEFGLLVVPAEIAEQFVLVAGADEVEAGDDLAAIHGDRVVVELHLGGLPAGLDCPVYRVPTMLPKGISAAPSR